MSDLQFDIMLLVMLVVGLAGAFAGMVIVMGN